MKLKVFTYLIIFFVGVMCLADSQTGKATKQEAVIKAKEYLTGNTYVQAILTANKDKDLLNPDNKIYSNSVVVSDDLSEVRFHHSGLSYDSDSITFIVKLDKKLSMKQINISITPGGSL